MNVSNQVNPEKITELFQSACQFHQDGKLQEAKSIYVELLDYVDSPLLHYNLGLVHYDLEEKDIALMWFDSAAERQPDDCDSLFNLGLCQKQCGKIAEAVITYQKVLTLDPENIDTMYNLAGCYRDLRCDEEAINAYHNVLDCDSNHVSAINNLAYMYQLTGNTTSAIHYYKRLLSFEPDREAARHMLASLEGITPDSPPESYVREVFDNYSERYEESLVKHLEYSVPVKLRRLLNSIPALPQQFNHGIDLGCGTGLSGDAFHDITKIFTGIDLAPKMIEQSKQKNIYTDLHSANIIDFLRSSDMTYDFIVAADVFIYLGNLLEVFQLAADHTQPDAIFCFSTETEHGQSFSLGKTGRYAHSHDYIKDLALGTGWQIERTESTNLRKERASWVIGTLWILRRKPNENL
jgi:predicted TPR repeat methyltransferase